VIYVFILFSCFAPSLSIRAILSFLAQEFMPTLLPPPLPPSLPPPLLSYFVLFIVKASTPNGILPFTLLYYFVVTLVATLVVVVATFFTATLPPQLRSRSISRLVFIFKYFNFNFNFNYY